MLKSAPFGQAPWVEHWNLIDRTEASPWMLADWEVASGTRVRVSAGLQQQAPTIDQALFSHQDPHLATEKATTVEAGLERRFGPAWRLSGSIYRRHERDRLRFVDSEIRVENNRVVLPSDSRWENALTGDGRGAELTLERKSVNGVNGWLSYAWNKATLENGIERSAEPASPA